MADPFLFKKALILRPYILFHKTDFLADSIQCKFITAQTLPKNVVRNYSEQSLIMPGPASSVEDRSLHNIHVRGDRGSIPT